MGGGGEHGGSNHYFLPIWPTKKDIFRLAFKYEPVALEIRKCWPIFDISLMQNFDSPKYSNFEISLILCGITKI